MSKLIKITNKISEKQSEIQAILRNIGTIPLTSQIGLLILDLWKSNIEEYGEIRYILKQPLTTVPENKYHVICFKYDQKNNTIYHSSWCIQIPIELEGIFIEDSEDSEDSQASQASQASKAEEEKESANNDIPENKNPNSDENLVIPVV